VAFPVCFAAEGLCAVGECATVGSFVAFLVLSGLMSDGAWKMGWCRG
jgi:hypothetical protein